MTQLVFRPHHFMCSLILQDIGYSTHFIKNFKQISNILKYDSDAMIIVKEGIDSICTPCPHHLNNHCKKQLDITPLDKAYARILNLKDGDQLSWKEAKKRIGHKMTIKKFHSACKTCEWKCLGICENELQLFLKKYHKNK
ncbi:hypothetical protein NOVO_06655 [Rickettsiales bacterium Ac37b]|nr:hypothetical protein NOVO_06655 [Rickettsiales bacterium Ac37b]